MPIINRVDDLRAEIVSWRRDFHAHPELQYDVHRTAAAVADKLKSFGCDEVATGIGRTGVVGVIRGRRGTGKIVGLRADMDALPIEEATELPYKSTVPGKMHACGHDGHMAMLLGAAKYLADTRNFAGTVVVIFQPAEEGGGAGARAMIQDGLFERFGIQEVFGMHNHPGLPIGEFAIRSGPQMASSDTIGIRLEGKGAHAAWPHLSVDTVLVGVQVVNALQSIVSRNVNPLDAAVISICVFQAGHVENVIPQHAVLRGTARSFSANVRDQLRERVHEIVEGTARAYGCRADLTYTSDYPVLVNDANRAAFVADVASEIAGPNKVNRDFPPMMSAEDFAFMLQQRPGAFIYVGNGDSAGLHHPAYNFNDEAIPFGTSYWARLAETALGE
jgi:amidohydrolase